MFPNFIKYWIEIIFCFSASSSVLENDYIKNILFFSIIKMFYVAWVRVILFFQISVAVTKLVRHAYYSRDKFIREV